MNRAADGKGSFLVYKKESSNKAGDGLRTHLIQMRDAAQRGLVFKKICISKKCVQHRKWMLV